MEILKVDPSGICDGLREVVRTTLIKDAQSRGIDFEEADQLGVDTAQLINALAAACGAVIAEVSREDPLDQRMEIAGHFARAMVRASAGLARIAQRDAAAQEGAVPQ